MRENQAALPGEELKPEKMPGYWVLAQMGKRVLRPGGIELTCCHFGMVNAETSVRFGLAYLHASDAGYE